MHFDWTSSSRHCSSAAEIFHFRLTRIHSNARNSIFTFKRSTRRRQIISCHITNVSIITKLLVFECQFQEFLRWYKQEILETSVCTQSFLRDGLIKVVKQASIFQGGKEVTGTGCISEVGVQWLCLFIRMTRQMNKPVMVIETTLSFHKEL